MLGGGQLDVRLVRRRCGRDEINEVQRKRLAVLFGRAQMAEVNRIEAAAEEAYPHEGISRLRAELIRAM